jgi:hypothetical protein
MQIVELRAVAAKARDRRVLRGPRFGEVEALVERLRAAIMPIPPLN